MKKAYQKPEALVIYAITQNSMLTSSTDNSATIGNDGQQGTGEKGMEEITDGDDFTMESKKNYFNAWEDDEEF